MSNLIGKGSKNGKIEEKFGKIQTEGFSSWKFSNLLDVEEKFPLGCS